MLCKKQEFGSLTSEGTSLPSESVMDKIAHFLITLSAFYDSTQNIGVFLNQKNVCGPQVLNYVLILLKFIKKHCFIKLTITFYIYQAHILIKWFFSKNTKPMQWRALMRNQVLLKLNHSIRFNPRRQGLWLVETWRSCLTFLGLSFCTWKVRS